MIGKEKTNYKKNRAGRLLAVILALTLFVSLTVVPQQTYAASMAKKAKGKYSVTVHNINSNTVLRKGAKLKISYTATLTKNGVVRGTKVKFKSSNKKVATVSKSGVIKAKKKGTVKITVYCKKKPSKKKTIKIRVGNPVSSISVSGSRYLRVGRSSTLKASVNSGASNKKVSWWSDNPGIVTVNSDGKIKGISSGIATVYATAKDGSGVSGSRKVYVHQYLAGEAKWIAHRGLHTSATENTAGAFYAAGQSGGFWGCECDIWETRHVAAAMPPLPGLPEIVPNEPAPTENNDPGTDPGTSDQNAGDATDPDSGVDQGEEPVQGADQGGEGTEPPQEDPLPDVSGLKDEIASWPAANSLEIVDSAQAVKDAWAEYNSKITGLSENQVKALHLELLRNPEDRSSEDLLAKLFDAYKWICEYDSIELAINHNSTFAEIWGNGNAVRNMSADEIRSQLPGVCFFAEYLDICKTYNMVPVIEFKDQYMSAAAINKALDMVNERGLLEKAYLISFYDGVLAQAKAQAAAKLGHAPITYYLISESGASKIDLASSRGYTGVSLSKSLISGDLYSRAKNYGLGVGTWTYKNQLSDDEKLYKHMFSYGWQLDFVTVDYHIFI